MQALEKINEESCSDQECSNKDAESSRNNNLNDNNCIEEADEEEEEDDEEVKEGDPNPPNRKKKTPPLNQPLNDVVAVLPGMNQNQQ